ncbi:MAG: alpha/beta fold hydrolase [Oceanococcus sp.]
MIASKFDTWRLARGLGTQSRDWALKTRPDIQLMDLPLARIRYRISGSGPKTIVFAADPPNVIEHYDRLVELLAPSYRVICLDMPGFGFSYPKKDFTYGMHDQVEVTAQFLRQLGYGPYHLAFSCGGALGAIGLATQWPDLVAGVINIQAASWDEQARWAQRVDLMGIVGTPVLGQLLLACAPNWVAQKWYDVALPSPDAAKDFTKIGSESIRHGACFCLASGLQQLRSNTEDPILRAVAQPSMVVWGGADKTHRRTDKHSSRRYFPNAQWHEFEHAGHFPELEMPEHFTTVLRDFIDSA